MQPEHIERYQFVESVASMMEQEGLPRMTGRVLGYLLICDPPHQSSAQLAEALNASRGAISTATRSLLQTGLIRRRPMPGSRATFLEMQPGAIDKVIHGQVVRIKLMRQLMEQGLGLLADSPPELRERLDGFHEVLAFFEAEFPKIIERWDDIHTTEESS